MKNLIAYFTAPMNAVTAAAELTAESYEDSGKWTVEDRGGYVVLEGGAQFVMSCIGAMADAGFDDLTNVEAV